MKRVLVCTFLILLLASCDITDLNILDIEESPLQTNSFADITASTAQASCTLLLTSDQHFSRSTSGVYHKEELFLEWVKQYQEAHSHSEEHLEYMISLGDITENSALKEFELFKAYSDTLTSYGITTYAVKGNHDIRPGTNHLVHWATYVGPSYHSFSYNGFSFYLLNSAYRTLGRAQMEKLREAVTQDPQPKILFSHVPLYGSPLLLYLTLSDPQEREAIIRLMDENRGVLFLAGHHHQGDLLYRFTNTTSEFILGAFHGRKSLFETTQPRWYLLFFDAGSSTLTITRYQVEEDETISEKVMATLLVE